MNPSEMIKANCGHFQTRTFHSVPSGIYKYEGSIETLALRLSFFDQCLLSSRPILEAIQNPSSDQSGADPRASAFGSRNSLIESVNLVSQYKSKEKLSSQGKSSHNILDGSKNSDYNFHIASFRLYWREEKGANLGNWCLEPDDNISRDFLLDNSLRLRLSRWPNKARMPDTIDPLAQTNPIKSTHELNFEPYRPSGPLSCLLCLGKFNNDNNINNMCICMKGHQNDQNRSILDQRGPVDWSSRNMTNSGFRVSTQTQAKTSAHTQTNTSTQTQLDSMLDGSSMLKRPEQDFAHGLNENNLPGVIVNYYSDKLGSNEAIGQRKHSTYTEWYRDWICGMRSSQTDEKDLCNGTNTEVLYVHIERSSDQFHQVNWSSDEIHSNHLTSVDITRNNEIEYDHQFDSSKVNDTFERDINNSPEAVNDNSKIIVHDHIDNDNLIQQHIRHYASSKKPIKTGLDNFEHKSEIWESCLLSSIVIDRLNRVIVVKPDQDKKFTLGDMVITRRKSKNNNEQTLMGFTPSTSSYLNTTIDKSVDESRGKLLLRREGVHDYDDDDGVGGGGGGGGGRSISEGKNEIASETENSPINNNNNNEIDANINVDRLSNDDKESSIGDRIKQKQLKSEMMIGEKSQQIQPICIMYELQLINIIDHHSINNRDKSYGFNEYQSLKSSGDTKHDKISTNSNAIRPTESKLNDKDNHDDNVRSNHELDLVHSILVSDIKNYYPGKMISSNSDKPSLASSLAPSIIAALNLNTKGSPAPQTIIPRPSSTSTPQSCPPSRPSSSSSSSSLSQPIRNLMSSQQDLSWSTFSSTLFTVQLDFLFADQFDSSVGNLYLKYSLYDGRSANDRTNATRFKLINRNKTMKCGNDKRFGPTQSIKRSTDSQMNTGLDPVRDQLNGTSNMESRNHKTERSIKPLKLNNRHRAIVNDDNIKDELGNSGFVSGTFTSGTMAAQAETISSGHEVGKSHFLSKDQFDERKMRKNDDKYDNKYDGQVVTNPRITLNQFGNGSKSNSIPSARDSAHDYKHNAKENGIYNNDESHANESITSNIDFDVDDDDEPLIQGTTITSFPNSAGLFHLSLDERLEFEIQFNTGSNGSDIFKSTVSCQNETKTPFPLPSSSWISRSDSKTDFDTSQHPDTLNNHLSGSNLAHSVNIKSSMNLSNETKQIINDNNYQDVQDKPQIYDKPGKSNSKSSNQSRRNIASGCHDGCLVIWILVELFSSDFYHDRPQGWAHFAVPICLISNDGYYVCNRLSPMISTTTTQRKTMMPSSISSSGISSNNERMKRQITRSQVTTKNGEPDRFACFEQRFRRYMHQRLELPVIRPVLSSFKDRLHYHLTGQLSKSCESYRSVSYDLVCHEGLM